VRVGHRRREAEACCPDITILQHDPTAEARAFEPVVAAVEAFAPRVEITRPGLCAVATRGPARYFGGEEALARRVVEAAHSALDPDIGAMVTAGVADGAFAAAIAARLHADSSVIPPEETAAFLAPLSVAALALDEIDSELPRLLVRLGLRTIGQLAGLAEADLLARFGPPGGIVWRRANGFDERPLDARHPPPDLVVSTSFDPPAERVDQAAFAARALAAELATRLADHGLACTRLRIEAASEYGDDLARLWRHDGPFTEGAVAERVRWQLDGWLTNRRKQGKGLGGGLTVLRLAPDEVVPGGGRQLGFFGGDAEADDRAARGLARVQGLLGPEAVVTAVPAGGRHPVEDVTLVPWGEPREPQPALPWPGRVPGPPPALVHAIPEPADVLDTEGETVTVSGRGLVSAAPARLTIDGEQTVDVTAWAGPWPIEERWWDPHRARRVARMQIVANSGQAYSLICEAGLWSVEATYD
jgi:protein ImuB